MVDRPTAYDLARINHNKGFHALAEVFYRDAYNSGGLGLFGKLYWLDCLVMLDEQHCAKWLINDIIIDPKYSENKRQVLKRFSSHANTYNTWNELRSIPEQFKVPPDIETGTSPPFYISSLGGTATAWLSASISAQPHLVCFHGTRSIPPGIRWDNFKPLSAKDFVKSLAICGHSTRNKKVFGAIHGFHGVALKDEIEKVGGRFAAVTRHPFDRIKSLCQLHLIREINYKYPETSDLKNSEVMPFLISNKDESFQVQIKRIVNQITRHTISYDQIIAMKCEPEAIFKMEKLTKNKSDLKKLLEYICPTHLIRSDKYLESSMEISNQHRRVSKDKESFAFERWPNSLSQIVFSAIKEFGEAEFNTLYAKYKYETDLDSLKNSLTT